MKKLILIALAMSAPSLAEAKCLSLQRSANGHEFFYNGCGVGVSVVWKDHGHCQSNGRAKYPCANYIGAGNRSTMITKGRVTYLWCDSPGGSGDVLAIENGYGNVVCKD